MTTFIVTANWTDQGIRAVKEAPKRVQAAREAAKKFGIEWKQFFLTSGELDMVLIVEAENGDSVAKWRWPSGSKAMSAPASPAPGPKAKWRS